MKRIALFFTAGIVILISVTLIYAHAQIRALDKVIPNSGDLFTALDVPVQDLPISIEYITTASQDGPFGKLGHVGVLISWPDGKSFLIDTGMKPEDAQEFGAAIELIGADPTQTFGAIEKQIGEEVKLIKGIGFTHLHSDHTLGLTDICAKLDKDTLIFQSEQQANNHTLATIGGQSLVDSANCSKSIFSGMGVQDIEGFPGLIAIPAGGHTPGSTIFATKVGGKVWVFAGDITNEMDKLHRNEGKGWAYSYLLVPEDVNHLENWRLWLNDLDNSDDTEVLVAHDLLAYENSELSHWQPDKMLIKEERDEGPATEPQENPLSSDS